MYYKSMYPDLPIIPEANVHHLLLNRPEQQDWPDYTLYVNATTGEQRSFRQFVERVRDGATTLGSGIEQGGLGISHENGEVVGILSENCLDYIALLHSLLAITVPFAMISGYSTPLEFKHAITISQATRVFVSLSLLPLALTSGLPNDRIYVLEGHVEGRLSYEDLVSRAQHNRIPRLPIKHATRDTLAYLVFSSGTSGLPKAVMISHGNLTNSLLQVKVVTEEVNKVQKPPVWNGPNGMQVLFNVLPIHHTYGLHVTCFRVFFSPLVVVVLPKWDVNSYVEAIPKYRATTIYLVPSLVHQLVHRPQFRNADLSTVQTVHCGAAYLPVSLSEALLSRFKGIERVGEGYGMSESTISIANKPVPGVLNGRAKNKPGSTGILLPGVEARVVREDGTLAAVNEPGELHVRSGCVALGYHNNEKATKETFVDGWLHTGDRIRIDEDGVLFFEDRAKDTLKVSGLQVSPVEIENTLLAHPDKLINDASVAGVSGGRTLDERIPRAWVVLSSEGRKLGASVAMAKLDAWVRESLSKYKWLRGGIEVVDEIPKSPTGKVLRRQLVEKYENEHKALKAKL
ncbi:acetyl-CoA synthetase-like protein [Rhizopogon vinicolor AM-OR11-026]|uniref:Acetyl-CoA synthetase-like protein n=1 Tax=Rhizopogon vinicolor AM-OR11-026 TaxID=1314800 RepID=A0A1B7MMY3_9AGAM|nr:acetyl-CoA synthetase-like protein [Rhizopogon vinicolor AM-OR11-026]